MDGTPRPRDGSEKEALTFSDVLSRELRSIRRGRQRVQDYRQASDATTEAATVESTDNETHAGPRDARSQAYRERLMGLALSGGGIRSATFNLGVLQGLAKLRLLRHFDYVSSVSGGGYIGCWLHSWIHREHAKDGAKESTRNGGNEHEADVANAREAEQTEHTNHTGKKTRTDVLLKVEEQLRTSTKGHEPREIIWLRRYSNYLTPRTGLLRPDALTAVSTVARNLLLNLSILLAGLVLVLLVPWAVVGMHPYRATWDALGAQLIREWILEDAVTFCD